MIDLDGEFARSLAVVPVGDTDRLGEWLAQRGLTADRREAIGGVGIVRATLNRSTRTWEPNDDGDRVLVTPAWVGQAGVSDIEDLVAWPPGAPAALFLRRGDAIILGADGLRQALETASPLRLLRNVEAFAKAGGETGGEYPAAVILNHALVGLHLKNTVALITDDIEHGREVRAILEAARPALPNILVAADAGRRAA